MKRGDITADVMVQNTQKWLNQTYGNDPRYNAIVENGQTGWPTIYALTRALQIELGIQNTADSFGPTTQALYAQNLLVPSLNQSNKHSILQGALWCKGYATNYTSSLPSGQLLGDQFDLNVTHAVLQLKSDAGIITNDATVTVNFMRALLSMDAFVLLTLYGGNANIRAFQQEMNRRYETFSGIMPTDGLYGRNTNTALIFALQYEQQMPISIANGNFGPTTRSLCPTIPYDGVAKSYLGLTYTSTQIDNFTQLLKFGLYVNGFGDGTFTGSIPTSVIQAFQHFYALVVTGIADVGTWMSVLTSAGDPYRPAIAADCATILDANTAHTLTSNGYQIIGRYLTGTANGVSKALTHTEIDIIFAAGLRFFPIYQTSGNNLGYFNSDKGISDAKAAYAAALALGIPFQTIIYFAVDFDALDGDITNAILPYFQAVKSNLSGYQVGIYGARNVCRRVASAGYSMSSFVSGMSTGFSGNLGFIIPDDWAFDQFASVTIGSGASKIDIDRVAYSGRDPAVKSLGFTIISPTGLNLLTMTDVQVPTTQIPLEYTRNDSSKWVYCNYPEGIQYDQNAFPNDPWIALADDNITDAGYFLNHQIVSTGTHQIFYSYQDQRPVGPFTLAIRIHNPNNNSIYITINRFGHKEDSQAPQGTEHTWHWTAKEVWRDFIFANQPQIMPSIDSGQDSWLYQEAITTGSLFTGTFEITVTGGQAEITVMLYKDINHIKQNLQAFPIVVPPTSPVTGDPRYYAGYGNGYINHAKPIHLKVSELTNGKYFLINYKNSFSNLQINSTQVSSDLISITHVTNNEEYTALLNANLGNWSAQNFYTFILENDTLGHAIIGGYVRADRAPSPQQDIPGAVYPIITTGDQFESAYLDRYDATEFNTWHWLSQQLDPGEIVTGTIQFILGTNSMAMQKMIFGILPGPI